MTIVLAALVAFGVGVCAGAAVVSWSMANTLHPETDDEWAS